jgi:hypothetical protein
MPTVQSYVIGDVLVGNRVRLSAEFKQDAELKDPTTVTFKVRDPNNRLFTFVFGTDPEVVRDGTGRFHFGLLLSTAGKYRYRWESTGPVTAANESTVTALASQV